MNYIGIDAHPSTCTFSVVDKDGTEIDNATMETNGRLLKEYLRSLNGKKKATIEECEISNWLFEIIKPEVDELIICNPVANSQYKKAKTDKLDARKLARLLRGNFLTPVFHDGSKREAFRSMISGYQDLIEDATRLKNRYKSLFRKVGEKPRGELIYSDESFLGDLKRPDYKFVGSHLYKLLEIMEESRKEYLKEIKKISTGFKEIKVLKSLPGIGDIQAARIVSQVVDPWRFANKYKYYSYCGLARNAKRSANKNHGSTKIWGNRILKCVYKMAGHSALRGDSALRKCYDNLRTKGVSHKNAYNAVCRKIAAISLSIWKSGKEYDDKILSDTIK
jgi:transposase